ncbi:MAG: DUF2508 family protein [Niameybacter sp.]|uniref:DUF2508 family protein n=1 Tax=Niameybacter sp. TaxID=2033640 RepID=UPI002FC711E7
MTKKEKRRRAQQEMEEREEEREVLADEITALHEEMAATLANFSDTIEPELLEYYTYYYKASQIKHSYLLKKLKKLYYEIGENRNVM